MTYKNEDSELIWEHYKSMNPIEEQVPVAAPGAPAAPLAPAAPTEEAPPNLDYIMRAVEQLFEPGIGQDKPTIERQVEALNTASSIITKLYNTAQQKSGSEMASAAQYGTGRYRATEEIDKLKQAYQRVQDLTDSIEPAAQQVGVRMESLKESLQSLGELINE